MPARGGRLVTASSTRPTRPRVVDQPIVNITLARETRKVLSIPEATEQLGISRSNLYQIVAAGEIRTIHIGRLRKVPVDAIDEVIDSLPSNGPPVR